MRKLRNLHNIIEKCWQIYVIYRKVAKKKKVCLCTFTVGEQNRGKCTYLIKESEWCKLWTNVKKINMWCLFILICVCICENMWVCLCVYACSCICAYAHMPFAFKWKGILINFSFISLCLYSQEIVKNRVPAQPVPPALLVSDAQRDLHHDAEVGLLPGSGAADEPRREGRIIPLLAGLWPNSCYPLSPQKIYNRTFSINNF